MVVKSLKRLTTLRFYLVHKDKQIKAQRVSNTWQITAHVVPAASELS